MINGLRKQILKDRCLEDFVLSFITISSWIMKKKSKYGQSFRKLMQLTVQSSYDKKTCDKSMLYETQIEGWEETQQRILTQVIFWSRHSLISKNIYKMKPAMSSLSPFIESWWVTSAGFAIIFSWYYSYLLY